MIKLNFPEYPFHILEREGKKIIFDPVRKKYVVLTPEEWVRQHVINFLIIEKNVPVGLIGVETEFKLFKTKKRFDLVVHDRNGKALILIECKAPAIPLTQAVLDQASRYNFALNVDFLMLTNGLQHIFCMVDKSTGTLNIIESLPVFQQV